MNDRAADLAGLGRADEETDDSSLIARAVETLGGLAQLDVPLATLTTYRVGGSAAVLVTPRTDDELDAVVDAARVSGLPILVVGRGSNLLIADEGFRGIAISTAGLADEITIHDVGRDPTDDPSADARDDAEVIVTAGGGVPLPVLARRTVAAGLTGFEWAVGVPGSVGGAVRMNAGGHGSDMASSLVDVDLLELGPVGQPHAPSSGGGGSRRRVPASSLGLRFRASSLTDRQLVVRARLALRRGDRAAGERELAHIVRWRRDHQPGGQNCGSVFVNPVPGELAAASLIDALGWRGRGVGGARVADKHANFVQASDGAAAHDVMHVIDEVRTSVADRWGLVLRSEVRTAGQAPPIGERFGSDSPRPLDDPGAAG